MSDQLSIAHARLRSIIQGYGSLLVAYSGGVDSSLVLHIAAKELGTRALGVIGNSPAFPASELSQAIALAANMGLPVRVIETNEHADPRYLANTSDRCFHCRSHLFEQLVRIASMEGYSHIADGVHAADLHDHQGGIEAARKHRIRSPLLEAGLEKDGVRAIARRLGLPVWDKPAMACLASRIPRNTPITVSLLSRVARAEQALRALGFVDFRVRHHHDLARIELTSKDLLRASQLHRQIVEALRETGYLHITVDLDLRPDFPASSRRNLAGSAVPGSAIQVDVSSKRSME